ncbi:hypothetical protein D3C83_256550 [compost metagenome]
MLASESAVEVQLAQVVERAARTAAQRGAGELDVAALEVTERRVQIGGNAALFEVRDQAQIGVRLRL